jgi:toxin-antitoxin system PIN domain toxin
LILIDANLLLYAYGTDLPEHEAARKWLESVLSKRDPVRLDWVTVLAFLRISTSPRAWRTPLAIDEAASFVGAWFARPNVAPLVPGERYLEILAEALRDSQARGPMVMDAHLAALAIEHGATLHTTDRDFTRFRGLRWVNPLEAAR